MPQDIVTIDVTALTAGTPQPDFGKILVIGAKGAQGDANTVKEYFDGDALAADFGAGTRLGASLETILGMGVGSAYVMGVEPAPTSENFASGSAGAFAATGEFDPQTAVVADNDGTPKDVVFTAASPPVGPAADTILVNTETKEWASAEAATGGGITFMFSTIDIDAAEAAARDVDFSILVYADLKADLQALGLLKDLQGFCDAENRILFVALAKEMAVDSAQALTTQLVSRNIFAIYHKSDSDVASSAAARASLEDPWNTLLYKRLDNVAQTTFYTRAELGQPGLAGTIEGGDANNLGPANAVISPQAGAIVLSNGLTTAGQASNYQFIDVTRARYYLERKARIALTSLRLRVAKIRYTPSGLKMVEGELQGVIDALVLAGGFSEASRVLMPAFANIPQADKANRDLKNVVMDCVLAGDIHKFSLKLILRV